MKTKNMHPEFFEVLPTMGITRVKETDFPGIHFPMDLFPMYHNGYYFSLDEKEGIKEISISKCSWTEYSFSDHDITGSFNIPHPFILSNALISGYKGINTLSYPQFSEWIKIAGTTDEETTELQQKTYIENSRFYLVQDSMFSKLKTALSYCERLKYIGDDNYDIVRVDVWNGSMSYSDILINGMYPGYHVSIDEKNQVEKFLYDTSYNEFDADPVQSYEYEWTRHNEETEESYLEVMDNTPDISQWKESFHKTVENLGSRYPKILRQVIQERFPGKNIPRRTKDMELLIIQESDNLNEDVKKLKLFLNIGGFYPEETYVLSKMVNDEENEISMDDHILRPDFSLRTDDFVWNRPLAKSIQNVFLKYLYYVLATDQFKLYLVEEDE